MCLSEYKYMYLYSCIHICIHNDNLKEPPLKI